MKKWLAKVLIYMLVIGFFGTFIAFVMAFNLGYESYKEARVQPIANYSHQIHVGKLGIKCYECHTNVDKGKRAGVPPVSKCMSCHRTAKLEAKGVKVLHKYWNKGEPVPWKQVNKIPRNAMVNFTHKRHVRFLFWTKMQSTLIQKGLSAEQAKMIADQIGRIPSKKINSSEFKAYLSMAGVDSQKMEILTKKWNQIHFKGLKQACYSCHGQVEYMGTPREVSPLKMGWCVSCHLYYQAPRDCLTCHK